MASRDGDHEEPAGRRPLPPEDRVWRHPAEIAWEAGRARRRRRRRQAGATFATGAAAVGFLWLGPGSSGSAPADVAGVATTMLTSLPSSVPASTAAPPATTAPWAPTSTTVAVASTTTTSAGPTPLDTTTSLVATTTAPPRPTVTTDPTRVLHIESTSSGEPVAGAMTLRPGYVVTSSRALDGVGDLVVRWGDEQRTGAVIGVDEVTDVAVIAITDDAPGGPAGATEPASGDLVDLTGLDGVLVRRTVVASESMVATADGATLVDVVRLDGGRESVPPGSPALATDGTLVGMIAATTPEAPAAVVPIDTVREIAEEIIADGRATHPWIGLTVRDPDGDERAAGEAGARVTELIDDGPAQRGGVEVGDLIVEIDTIAVDSSAAFVAALRARDPGDTVELVVERKGEPVACTVVLDSHVVAVA